MPSAVGGQHLVDAAHGRDLLHVGIHLLVARRGKHAPASEARLVPLVAAQDFERGRKQRDAAHDGGLFARLVDPPPPLVVLREVLAPQVVGVGEGQPRQAAEDEDVADAGQPVVELLAGQQFQFMRRKVLFGLHLVLFEFIVAERIFRDPLVAQAVEDEVAQTVHDGDRPVVAAAVGGVREEVEALKHHTHLKQNSGALFMRQLYLIVAVHAVFDELVVDPDLAARRLFKVV